jgi:hypothetical protein
MKRFYSLLAALIFSISINAQTSSGPQAATANGSAGTPKDEKTALVKGSKVVIPSEKARPMTIPKFAEPITIDGRPDEEAWKNAAVFKDFYQTGPGDNIAPSKPTEVLMMYDEKNLYVAFKCWDDKGKIRATVAKRDNV